MRWNNPNGIKAAFFDVDGTLVSFKTHEVPDSARRALVALREAGVHTFLATGRPSYQLDPVKDCDFEGQVLLNGQYCCVDDRVVYKQPLDPKDVATVVTQVKSNLYQALFMELDRCYVSGHDDRVRAIEETAHLTFPEEDIDQALEHDVYQLNVYFEPSEDDLLLMTTNNFKMTRWTPLFADVMPKHGGKAKGVRTMLSEYGLTPDEAVAFGDGGNDLSMFGVVGTSVSMGNGNPEVKEQADYVTDDVDHDGILNACVSLGLIEG